MNNELNSLKKSLDEFLSKKRQKELGSERDILIKELVAEVSAIFKPILESMARNSQITREELRMVAEDIATKINLPEINIPDIIMPEFPQVKVPEPRVTVNFDASKIRIPDVVMPDMMDVKGMVSLEGVDMKHPLPVTLRDKNGEAVDLASWTTSVIGGGGGKADFFTVKGITNTVGVVTINPDGSPTYGSGAALGTVSVSDIFGTVGTDVVNPDGRIKVELPTGSSGLTDTELRASSVPIAQVSGSIWSTELSIGGNPISTSNAVPIQPPASGSLTVSGTVAVSDITNTIGSNIVDSSGVAYSGSNPVPISDAGGSITVDGTFWQATQPVSGTVVVSSITATVAAMSVDSTGVGYSGSNPLPITAVSGVLTSTVSVGDIVSDGADTGSAPVKMGGIARQANPTAVAAGDRVSATFDDLGRQLIRPVQVRDLISTAYVNKTTGSTFGTETTLFAGATNTYHDLIYILASNDSTAAIGVDIRGTTGGNVLMHLEIPANSTTGLSLPVPLPAGDVGASWTVDLPDVTGTNVYVSALFTKEV